MQGTRARFSTWHLDAWTAMIDCLKKNLFRLHGQNARVKRSDSDSSTTSGSKTSYPETALAPISRKSLGAITLCVTTALRPYRIKPSARWFLNGLDTAWNSLAPCAAMPTTSRFAPSPATTAWPTLTTLRTGVPVTASSKTTCRFLLAARCS